MVNSFFIFFILIKRYLAYKSEVCSRFSEFKIFKIIVYFFDIGKTVIQKIIICSATCILKFV